MAFPFGLRPSLGIFIENAVNKYGAELTEAEFTVRCPSGEIRPRMLKRVHEGNDLSVMLPDIPNEEPIDWHVIRNLCDRLAIPTMDYDFVLTDKGLEPIKVELKSIESSRS